jgi:hypothetical protein
MRLWLYLWADIGLDLFRYCRFLGLFFLGALWREAMDGTHRSSCASYLSAAG